MVARDGGREVGWCLGGGGEGEGEKEGEEGEERELEHFDGFDEMEGVLRDVEGRVGGRCKDAVREGAMAIRLYSLIAQAPQ